MANINSARGRAAIREAIGGPELVQKRMGILNVSEAKRIFDARNRLIPESAPDAEEVMRRNRRKFLSQQRRRSGRMSTILTGGDTSGMGLG